MRVDNHFAYFDDGRPVPYHPSPNKSNGFDPKFITIHYTAGRLNINNPINWLTNPKAKASAHFIIGLKPGEVVQLVPTNMKAWHAGTSVWKRAHRTYKGLNQYSYGIELVNPGVLQKRGDGQYYTSHGVKVDSSQVILAKHKNGGQEKAWMSYSEWQVDCCYELCEALIDLSSSIVDVVGHDDIAPGRKLDPGPAFNLEQLRTNLFGRKDK